MFSKSKINEPAAKAGETPKPETQTPSSHVTQTDYKSTAPKAKPPASSLSADLTITGNLKTSGDINIEGQVEGDIRAHLLTIGEGATVKGECIADDVVVNGRIVGTVRGLKVRLTSSARVEGDIIHKTIAIESGAHFEGSVRREEDPLGNSGARAAAQSSGSGQGSQSGQSGAGKSGSQQQQPAAASSGTANASAGSTK